MQNIDWTPNKVNSISSTTGRLVVEEIRTAQVHPGSSSKIQIAALLDLLDLHLSQDDCGQSVNPKEVTLRIPDLTSEARGALGTISDALRTDLRLNVLELSGPTSWEPTRVGWNPADLDEYARWPQLLTRPRPVPTLVTDIINRVNNPALRAYPLLSTTDGWSLRVEGLEVARVARNKATLNVGKDAKTGARSLQRTEWITATGRIDAVVTDEPSVAASLISRFADAWHGLAATKTDQNEHALESRILRGDCGISINGTVLESIQPDPVVNWGSQFPTKWGPGGDSRYLDALLRDGSTPWAIEMKVQGSAGVGQYYRHGVAQAVLYREFIRRATPLHPWFDDRGLNAEKCEAAVVVPRLTNPQHVHWRDRLVRLCDVFDVAFVEVDPKFALRH